MKKFLLSLAVLSGAAFTASADEATITIKGADSKFADKTVADLDKDADFEFTNQGFTFVTSKGGTTTAYNKAGDLRIYAGGTITITGAGNMNIQKVVFNLSKQGLTRLAPITASVGTIATQAAGDKTVTWTGDANSIKYTVGAKADFGSDGPTKSGQFDFTSIVITYTQTGVAKKNADMAFDPKSVTLALGEGFTQPTLTKATTAAVAYTSSDEAVATVDAATGAVTILAVGETVIEAKADENDEYYAGSASYTITVKEPVPAGTIVLLDPSLENGIEGWTLSADNLPEGLTYVWNWKSYDNEYYLNGSAFANNTAYPVSDCYAISPVVDLTDYNDASMKFEHTAKFQTTLKTLCGVSVREEGAAGWTPLEITEWPVAGSWTWSWSNVIDLKAYAGKKIQIGFKYGSTAEGADTWEIRNLYVSGQKSGGLGIVDSMVEENAPEVYYNLQGIRLANPEKGQLVIVRKGNKTFKAIL